MVTSQPPFDVRMTLRKHPCEDESSRSPLLTSLVHYIVERVALQSGDLLREGVVSVMEPLKE